MKKRIISALLVLCLVLSMAISAWAVEEVPTSGTCGENATWTLSSNGTLTISGTGKIEQLDTGVSYGYCFPRNVAHATRSVVIEDGISSIGRRMFQQIRQSDIHAPLEYDFDQLEHVIIADSVIEIEDMAFAGCPKLREVTLPETLKKIGYHVFEGTSITSIKIPSGTLFNSSMLVENHFEDPVDVGDPIGGGKFLEYIDVDPNNQVWSSQDGILFSKDGKELFRYPAGRKGETYNIPSEVDTIWDFSGSEHLVYLTIPKTVTEIGNFRNCKKLARVICQADIIETAEDDGYDMGPAYMFSGCTALTDIVFEGELNAVGWEMFYGCTSLKNVTLPNSVTRIYYGAFQNCTSLENIIIPDSVSYIGGGDGEGNGVFEGCTSLKSVKLPDNSLLKMYGGNGAFYGCTSLESITFPKNFTMVAADTFRGCTNLKDIYYGGSQMQWDNRIVGYWGEDGLDTSAKIHFGEITTTDSSCVGPEDDEEDVSKIGEMLINNNLDIGDKIIRLGGLVAASMFADGDVPFTLGYLYEEEGLYTGKLSLDEDGKTVLFTADEGQTLPLGFTIRPVTGTIATPIPVVRGDAVPFVADGVAPECREAALALASSVQASNIINGARIELAQIAEQVATDENYENPRILVSLKVEVEDYIVENGKVVSFTLNLTPCYSVEGKKEGESEVKELQTKTFLSIDDIPAPVAVEMELPEGFALSDEEKRMQFQMIAKGHDLQSAYVSPIQRDDKELGFFYLYESGKYTFVKDERYLEVTYHFNDKSACVSEYTLANLGTELRTDAKSNATFLGWSEDPNATQAAYSGKLTEEIFEQMFQKNNDGDYRRYTSFDVYPIFKNDSSSAGSGSGGGGGIITAPTTPTTPTIPTTPAQSTTPSQPSTPSASTTKQFTDVAPGEYYAEAVAWAVERGITTGLTETTFGPNACCTRAQMVTFLWRAAGCPEPATATVKFEDVDPDGYYYKAMLWAVEKGITTGTTDATFSPDEIVTRAQTVTFLYRYAGCPSVEGDSAFTDLQTGAYYEDAVQWAVDNHITNGTSETTFSPVNHCTRGQIVTFLYRQIEK